MLHRIWIAAAMVCVVLGGVLGASGQQAAKKTPPAAAFAPLEQWKAAVLARDAAKLRALYSTNPEARVILTLGETNAQADAAFWIGLKVRGIKFEMAQSTPQETGTQQIAFQAEIKSAAQNKLQTIYVIDGQLWQKQGETWRIVATRRGDVTRLQQPLST